MGSSYGWFLFYVYCMFVVKIRVSCQLRKKPTQEFSPFLKELIYQGPLTIFLFPFWFLRIDLLAPPNEKEVWQYRLLNVNQLYHVPYLQQSTNEFSIFYSLKSQNIN